MRSDDPERVIDEGAMNGWQWAAVVVMMLLNALDGFDVLSISFASPGIARDWSLTPATLGWILSMEVIGMSLGSVVLGGVADRVGRRPTLLGCLAAMTVGMFFAGQSEGVGALLAWRLLTGLGIGGVLATINAATAEYSNRRWRATATSLMVIGYPLGGVFGGMAAQVILRDGGWQGVFTFGAVASALCIPLAWFLVPETPAFLAKRRPSGALEKVNRVLARFGHPPMAALAAQGGEASKTSIADLLKPGLAATTLVVTAAYFLHFTSFYYLIKWIPKIVVDLGFAPQSAAGVLTWVNVGGATGAVLFGLLAVRLGLKHLTIFVLFASFLTIVWFGFGARDLAALSLTVAASGFFINSGIAGLYALFARVFPTHLRATGTGFAIGLGRVGGALAPIIAGYLFAGGLELMTVSLIMGAGSLLGALTLLGLRARAAEGASAKGIGETV